MLIQAYCDRCQNALLEQTAEDGTGLHTIWVPACFTCLDLARKEGYEAGYEEGEKEGYRKGHEDTLTWAGG